MLTNLLDGMSHATCSHRFTWCSMKSIGSVSLCNKIPLCLLRRAFIRVAMLPSLMMCPVSSMRHQAALQATSSLVAEKFNAGPYTSFPCQTIQSLNIPLKSTRIQIWAISSPNPNNWLGILSSQRSSFTHSSLLVSSETLKRFLHACTPERRTRALAHLFTQREHGHTPDTTKHILQKKRWVPETVENDSSGGASKPHRSKYIASAHLFCPFYRLWRSRSWKA